jgi:putative oxidoreductase
MNPNTQNAVVLVGRILLAVIFILSGIGKITGYDGTAAYMASKGLPMVGILLPLTILTELGGGLLLAVGFKARWAALWLFLFLIPTTLIFHKFWGIDPKEAQNMQIHFMKNVAIMGGMLMVFAFGPGRYSVDKS